MKVWPGQPYPLGATYDGAEIQMRHILTARQRRVLLAGGFIRYFGETGRFD